MYKVVKLSEAEKLFYEESKKIYINGELTYIWSKTPLVFAGEIELGKFMSEEHYTELEGNRNLDSLIIKEKTNYRLKRIADDKVDNTNLNNYGICGYSKGFLFIVCIATSLVCVPNNSTQVERCMYIITS